MKSKLYILLISTFFAVCCMMTTQVTAQNLPDSKMPFVVNPNPHLENPDVLVPLEEVFGSNVNIFGPAGVRGRGNAFLCTTARKLVEHRLYLNAGAGTNMWFVVYEGSSFNGTYNLVNSVNLPNSGPGEGWYSSGAIDFDFQSGMYYLIYTLFDVSANYYNQQTITPYPIDCSFGQMISGVGWNWSPVYASPPNPTETPTEVENSGVAYYQTIVTDDILPVELMSFTYQVVNNDVNLNWVTATETNNQGFEIQRKTGEEYSTIGFVNGYGTTTENHNYSYSDKNLQPGIYTYRLKQIDLDGTFKYYDPISAEISAPVSFNVAQNYPNPFNPSTRISFTISQNSFTTLKVYDVLGNEVASLLEKDLAPGSYDINFNATELTSGIYYYTLRSGNSVETKKMMLLK
jgi:Secretion system C-terminal sorting domain